jgi:hypothetical protein
MNKSDFISGCPFKIGRSETYTFVGTKEPVPYFVGSLNEVDWKGRQSYHCNVSKITNKGIRVYKTLAGQSINRFIQFDAMVKV